MTEIAGTTSAGIAASRPRSASIESRGSWIAAGVTLALLSVSYGSPLLVVVGLKPITEDLGTARQMVALAGALTWLGTGAGGILMGWVAERTSIRFTVIFGTVMIALGLAVSASGNIWAILIGHTLLVGLLGNGALGTSIASTAAFTNNATVAFNSDGIITLAGSITGTGTVLHNGSGSSSVALPETASVALWMVRIANSSADPSVSPTLVVANSSPDSPSLRSSS